MLRESLFLQNEPINPPETSVSTVELLNPGRFGPEE